MAEKDESGIIGQIRRLSRRLSGNILSADPKDVRAYMNRMENRRNIYSYDNEDQLRIGDILLKDLAEEYGTPLYIYDANRIYDNFNVYNNFLKNKHFSLCYPVKSNSNLAILNILFRLETVFEASSGGEIARCLAAGIDPMRITFSGCGKTNDEIDYAVRNGIYCINVDSWEELDRIENIAVKHNKTQNVAIRIVVDLTTEAHANQTVTNPITNQKYGVPIGEALEIYSRVKASSSLKIKGISCNIGPQVTHLESYLEIRDKILHLADELRQESKICVEHIEFGGDLIRNACSFGTDQSEVSNWCEKISSPILERGLKLFLNVGRYFLADAGVLLTKIEYIKTPKADNSSGTTAQRSGSFVGSPGKGGMFTKKSIAIVDAGFNDFADTCLFGQLRNIVPVHQQQQNGPASGGLSVIEYRYDIVGPISESIDTFHKDFVANHKLTPGEYLVISDAGTYGSSTSSNFQSRNRPAEVLISERTPILINERQKYEEQYCREKLVPDTKLSNRILEEAESQEELPNN